MSSAQSLSYIPLGVSPTPLHPLTNLAAHLGGPSLLVKREDLSGLGAGGNKVRKLRYLLADARNMGATVVLTGGGPQSNHCAQTACAVPSLGMRAELFFTGDDPATRTGNLRIDTMLDARLHFTGVHDAETLPLLMEQRADDLRRAGEVPYVIGLGGSDPLGAAGYASAVDEVVAQWAGGPYPTHMVVAAGSLGTLAGIILGTWVHGLTCRVDGISVGAPARAAQERLDGLLATTHARYFPQVRWQDNYGVSDAQVGVGYGHLTAAGTEAMQLAARLEGILLDSTYTAKTLAGLIAGCRSGQYRRGDTVLFWHTGGLGGFFA